MRKAVTIAAILFFGLIGRTWGQTTYNLAPDTPCSVIQNVPLNYWNVFCSDMPVALPVGQSYDVFYISISAHFVGTEIESGNVQFWDTNTGSQVNIPLSGAISGSVASHRAALNGTFSGQYSGSIAVDLVGTVGRYTVLRWIQQDSALTVN